MSFLKISSHTGDVPEEFETLEYQNHHFIHKQA